MYHLIIYASLFMFFIWYVFHIILCSLVGFCVSALASHWVLLVFGLFATVLVWHSALSSSRPCQHPNNHWIDNVKQNKQLLKRKLPKLLLQGWWSVILPRNYQVHWSTWKLFSVWIPIAEWFFLLKKRIFAFLTNASKKASLDLVKAQKLESKSLDWNMGPDSSAKRYGVSLLLDIRRSYSGSLMWVGRK